MNREPRIAIVHDWLEVKGGAENTLEQMLLALPGATLFTLIDALPADKRDFLQGRTPKTSIVQRLPFARKHFRRYFWMFPYAIEQLDLSGFDVIVSSSYAFAKGCLAGPDQFHYCYCYSPIRYAWDLQQTYLAESGLANGPLSWVARSILHRIRLWDRASSVGVDHFAAISHFVRRRIKRCYRRDAHVIYPPVDTERFSLKERKEDFYLTASRLVPYKRIALIAEAFARMPERKLVIIGDGPERSKIERICRQAPNITYLGFRPTSELVDHMQRAKAFVFASKEDFGIVLLEANACGTPVIAFADGAARETVRTADQANPTGVTFDEQTADSVVTAVQQFENASSRFRPHVCRQHALTYSCETFRRNFREHLMASYAEWQASR